MESLSSTYRIGAELARLPSSCLRRRQQPPRQLQTRPHAYSISPNGQQQLMRQEHRTGGGLIVPALGGDKLMSALGHHPWQPEPHHLPPAKLWKAVQREAGEVIAAEPALASFINRTVHPTLHQSLAFLLANKLGCPTLPPAELLSTFARVFADPKVAVAAAADLQAVFDRDPACERYLQCVLFFKGFQAIQAHRVAHRIWRSGRRDMALALQNRMSEVWGVDIHPAATIGRGVMLDHASGIVIGETAVVGDNVSMLHHVTLGGSGTEGAGATRHPIIGNGALLGTGVTVLGPVVVGHSCKIGAGSLVLSDIPPSCVAVGMPARVVKQLDRQLDPMDQGLEYILDYEI